MRKVIKIFITFIILITMSMQYNTIYAINYKDGGGNGKSTKWTSQSPIWYKPTSEDVGQEEIKDKANIITKAIRNIGIVVAVIALMVIGFRNMVASIDEKSIIKESLPGYLIGVVMVVALTMIPAIIYEIVKQF